MSKYSQTVEYNIKTNLDASGVQKLQTELTSLQRTLREMASGSGAGFDYAKTIRPAIQEVEKLKAALNSAYNSKLGMLDLSKLNSQLKSSAINVQQLNKAFSLAGSQGTVMANNLISRMYTMDKGLQSVSKTTDKIANTIGNTFRWGLIASGFSQIMNSAHGAAQYVKDLDTSLTNIMMVSGQTKDNMNEFAKLANEAAQRLGATTTQMTEAAKVFVQQGMNTPQSLQMGEYAVHLANISEQDSSTTSDELTAMKNAFKLNIDDMGNAISKWAAIANHTAVDMEELSVASQKAASVANTVGVDMDQFAGHIAAIEATTREAPENIGNGLKTLYSRISDIKLGDTLEDGVDYGQFSSALLKIGVDVLDPVTQKMKDAGDIIEEIMAKWQDLDSTQRTAVATTVAGRFQLARFEALMNSADIYKTAVNTAQAETGTSTYDQMQEDYRNSLEGRSKALQSSIEGLFGELFETDDFYKFIDAAQGMVDVLTTLTQSFGDGKVALGAFSALLGQVFSTQLSRGISNMIQNRQVQGQQRENANFIAQQGSAMVRSGVGSGIGDARNQHFESTIAKSGQYANLMNSEEMENYQKNVLALAEAENQLAVATEELENKMGTLKGDYASLAKNGELTKDSILELKIAFEQTEKPIQAMQKSMSKLQSVANSKMGAQEKAEALQKTYAQLEKQMKALEKAGMQKFNPEGYEKLKNTLEMVNEELQKGETNYNKLKPVMAQTAGVFQEVAEQVQKSKQAFQEDSEAIEQLGTDAELAGARVRQLEASFEGAGEKLSMTKALDSVTSLAFGLGQIAFSAQAVGNLVKTAFDDSISPMEKFQEIFIGLSFNLPMLIMGFQQAAEGIKNFALATVAGTAAADAHGVALAGATIKQLALNAAEAMGIPVAEGLTVATIGLGTAVKLLLLSFAPIAAIAAGVGLAIWGIVSAVQAADAHFHRFDTAVEDATAKVDSANKSFSIAKTKLQDIDNALDSLNDNPFEGLTKGSQEWTNALIENNNKVLELIDKYPELADSVIHGKNGELTFNEKGLKEYEKAVQQEVISAQARTVNAKIEENAAKETQSAVNLLRAGNNETNFSALKSGYTTTAVGADGYASFNYNEEAAANKITEAARFMADADNLGLSDDELITELQKQGIASEDVARELVAAKEQMIALGQNAEKNSSAIEGMTQAYAASMMSENKKYQAADANTQAIVDKQIAGMITDKTGETYQNGVKAFDASGKNWDDQSLQQWYADKVGGIWDAAAQTIVDSAGNVIEDKKNNWYEIMREAYISDQIAADIKAQGDDIVTAVQATVDSIKAVVGEKGAALFDGQGGINGAALSNMTEDEFQQFGANMAYVNPQDLISMGFGDESMLTDGIISVDEMEQISIQLREALQEELKNNPLKPELDTQDLKTQIESLTAENQGLDADANEEQWKDLAGFIAKAGNELEGFSDDLRDNADDAADVAEEILRYDSALEKAQKSMEDWEKMLSSGAVEDQAKAVSELSNVYEDLLDIPDGELSAKFAADPTNLENLKAALEGDEEAYNRLAEAAAQDILMQVGFDDSQARSKIQTLQADLDAINFQELEIGAHVNSDQLESDLNEIIAASGMTAAQAEALLASMGMEGEIEETTEEQPDKQEYVSFKTTVEPTEAVDVSTPATDGEGGTTAGKVQSASVTVTPEKGSIDASKAITGFGFKAKGLSTGATSGGGVKIKHGSLKKAASGGAKFANASHGGGASGGGGGGGCFVAGTQVTTLCGYKNIEDIRENDVVLSYNLEKQQLEYSEVVDTMIHRVEEKIYTLFIEDEELVVTGNHKFLVSWNGTTKWFPAEKLHTNDLVLFANGTWHKVWKIRTEKKKEIVYNFEVSNNHNYFVGKNQILAHNKGGGGKKGGGKKAQKQGYDLVGKKNYQKHGDSEIDLYNKVNSNLARMEDTINKLDKKKTKLWGEKYRKAIQKEADALAKENKEYARSNQITQNLIAAYKTTNGQNLAYGIDLNGETLKKYGLTDTNNDGTVDNYVSKYVQAKAAADDKADAVAAAQAQYDAYLKKHGKKNKATGQYEVTKDSKADKQLKKMNDKIKDLTEEMNKAYEKANKITEVTNKYQEAWQRAREEAEKMTENSMRMEELQIDLWNRSRDTIGNLKKLNEQSAYLAGFFTGMKKDNPFRVLTQDLAEMNGLMTKVTDKGIKYFNEMKKKSEEVGDTLGKQFWADKAKQASDPNASLGDLYQSALEYLKSDAGKNMFYYDEYKVDENGAITPSRVFDEAGYQEALKNAYDDMIEYLQTIEDMAEQITDDIIKIYDEEQKRIDDLKDKQETLNKTLEHQYDMIKLIHGESAAAYRDLAKVNAATVDAYLADGGIVDRTRQQKEYWDTEKAKREQALEEQYKGVSQEELLRIKLSDKILQDLEDKADAANDAFQDATKAAAEAMNKQYEDANTLIAKDFNNKILAAGKGAATKFTEQLSKDLKGVVDDTKTYIDAEFFDKQWEMAKDSSDAYLDSVERSYELEKLRSKYQKMIDGTNDLKTQNKIKAAMNEQLKALENQKKAIIDNNGELQYQTALSQFDVDLANAKIELLQKQIALEEAQRNKQQMQLKRDTQGNYRYVYRANNDDVDEAKEALADSDYEIYEMSKQRYSDLLQTQYQLLQEYNAKVAWANEQYKDDEKAKTEALAQIADWYKERTIQTQDELADAQAGMLEGVEHLAEDTTDYVSQTFEDIGEAMREDWGNTLNEIGVIYSENLANMAADTDTFMATVDKNTNDLIDTTVRYTDEVTKLERQAHEAYDNIGSEVDRVRQEQDKLNKSTKEYMDIINADTGGIGDAQKKLQEYETQIQNLQKSSSDLATALKSAQSAREEAEAKNLAFQTNINTKNTGNVTQGQTLTLQKGTEVFYGRGGKQSDKSGRTSYKLPADTKIKVLATNVHALDKNGNPTDAIAKYPITIYKAGEQAHADRSGKPASRADEHWHVNASIIAANMKLKSGGYTGTWSNGEPGDADNGRWALLHQKELVLNAHDTENMLAAVSVVRDMISNLKTTGGSIFNTIGKVSSDRAENTIEQRVEINAEFPNVDDASDIRQALLSLSDSAYQYAYKNKGRSA